MKSTKLPNQLTIATLTTLEARVLYHEIFTSGTYLKHGITLHKNDCIFDVGANIGMFSLYATGICQELKLFAFEPVPEIYSVLQKNISDHLSGQDVHLFNFGISDKNRTVDFQYNTSLSITAGMYAADLEKGNQKNKSIYQWLQALLADFSKSANRFNRISKYLIHCLQKPVVKVLVFPFLLIPLIGYLFFLRITMKKVICGLQTLSSVINENHVEMIDLCKIDVEGSEWDVLQGIEKHHWHLFKQFIIEVHNLDNRVVLIQNLLEQNGFEVIIDQEDWHLHQLMNIFTVYAKRKINTLH